MHLKFCLPYVLLATHEKPLLHPNIEGVTPRGSGLLLAENAGYGSGAGDA